MALTEYWNGSQKYICDAELAQAFHMARVLGMPLLIEGEPGTGKTELPIQYAKDANVPLFVYPTGSKSNVEQFVARFDHVKYLRDSQIEILNAQREEKGLQNKLSTGGRNSENLADYVVKGPAAQAYSTPNSVLLIDEIDKAPREFPNDLLYALSHRKFVMPESDEVIEISEEEMPAIVITSNREQELPTAFKGRCIYHY
ncbi:MAG: MoxR family ATPase, partial [Spirosomaceae bacterium]|nr:MoxR family ATPase [Spirosomataceae bacterium]